MVCRKLQHSVTLIVHQTDEHLLPLWDTLKGRNDHVLCSHSETQRVTWLTAMTVVCTHPWHMAPICAAQVYYAYKPVHERLLTVL